MSPIDVLLEAMTAVELHGNTERLRRRMARKLENTLKAHTGAVPYDLLLKVNPEEFSAKDST